MKINEVVVQRSNWQYHVSIEAIENYVMLNRRSGLDSAYEFFIGEKEYQYKGSMFRALNFKASMINKLTSTVQLTTLLQKYDQQRPDRTLFGWTKSHDIGDVITGVHFEKRRKSPFYIVISQNGTGLDLSNLPFYNDNVKDRADHEEEILAPMFNTVHLDGFYIESIGGEYFQASDFNGFLSAAKRIGK